jgi:hypothetical protein
LHLFFSNKIDLSQRRRLAIPRKTSLKSGWKIVILLQNP